MTEVTVASIRAFDAEQWLDAHSLLVPDYVHEYLSGLRECSVRADHLVEDLRCEERHSEDLCVEIEAPEARLKQKPEKKESLSAAVFPAGAIGGP